MYPRSSYEYSLGRFAGWEDEDGLSAMTSSIQSVLPVLTKMPTSFFACSMRHKNADVLYAIQYSSAAVRRATMIIGEKLTLEQFGYY